MPEERDLLDIGRDTPCARGPGGEEYDVAWAEPTFFALPIGNEGLAGDDDRSLFLVVMPVEASGRALPDHAVRGARSEEHTSELQSLAYLVCRLLLEKKKDNMSEPPRRIAIVACRE